MITLDNISFSYKKNNVLKDISLSIPTGKCIGIIGANGCGKSTLLSILAGAKKADRGTLSFDGKNSLLCKKEYASKIGYVPQENPLLSDLSVYDNLFLWYNGKKTDFKEKLESREISLLGIHNYIHKPIHKLSGGMKKRVSIAIAFLNSPSVLILDEPSAALDLPCKMDIFHALSDFKKSGNSVILTTHDEVELSLCDALYVLKDGSLTEIDKTIRGEALIKLL